MQRSNIYYVAIATIRLIDAVADFRADNFFQS